MKKIPIKNRRKETVAYALVDDEDFERLSVFNWHFKQEYAGYAEKVDGVWHHYYMHRIITGCKKGLEVDHINGKKTDNRKKNLRVCTRGENLKFYYERKKRLT